MSEILDVLVGSQAYWLILDCGHWYKWTGDAPPPETGADFRCPGCTPVTVSGRS